MPGSTATGLVFVCFNRKTKVYVAERELLKYHEYFPILVFEESLSIEMAL